MLINLCPHVITIHAQNGVVITIEPEGTPARLKQGESVLLESIDAEFDDIPIYSASLGEIIDLPDPQEGVIYIVSMVVAQKAAAMGRMDVVSPGTGPNDSCIRNEAGQIVAITRLCRW